MRAILTGALAALLVLVGVVPALAAEEPALRGINLAGAEFTSAGLPVFDSAQSFAFVASRGYTVVRLPFLWESMQPTLSSPLKPESMARLEKAVTDAAAAGLRVILDVHNYARYRGVAYGASGSFTEADFSDLWTRLSTAFRGNTTIAGYGLMNEPRALPTVDGVTGNLRWQQAQQAALDAIRANGDTTCVLVSGYTAGTLGGWMNSTNGQPVPYITDPADNFRWEAHHYWDAGSTGAYTTSYADAVASGFGSSQGDALRTRTYFELNQWIEWLKTNHQKGYLGEFGWPSAEHAISATDAAAWNSLAELYLDRIDAESPDLVWATAWATGSRWSSGYALQFYSSTDGALSTPLSNAATLEAFARKVLPVATAEVPVVEPVRRAEATVQEAIVQEGAAQEGAVQEGVASVVPAVETVRPQAKARATVRVAQVKKKLVIRVKSATGTVTVRVGKKVVAKVRLVRGAATIKLKLARGRHALTVSYNGSRTMLTAKKTLRVRV